MSIRKTRLTQSHDSSACISSRPRRAALPTETFPDKRSLTLNGELVAVIHVAPAHTDTDIFVHYTRANVLHMGDVFFNGTYPFIDAGRRRQHQRHDCRRRSRAGDDQRANTDRSRPRTAVRSRGAVEVSPRDRDDSRSGAEMKRGKKTLTQVQSAKPSAQFDAEWGKGMMAPERFCRARLQHVVIPGTRELVQTCALTPV